VTSGLQTELCGLSALTAQQGAAADQLPATDAADVLNNVYPDGHAMMPLAKLRVEAGAVVMGCAGKTLARHVINKPSLLIAQHGVSSDQCEPFCGDWLYSLVLAGQTLASKDAAGALLRIIPQNKPITRQKTALDQFWASTLRMAFPIKMISAVSRLPN
jgi:hypothetical protein